MHIKKVTLLILAVIFLSSYTFMYMDLGYEYVDNQNHLNILRSEPSLTANGHLVYDLMILLGSANNPELYLKILVCVILNSIMVSIFLFTNHKFGITPACISIFLFIAGTGVLRYVMTIGLWFRIAIIPFALLTIYLLDQDNEQKQYPWLLIPLICMVLFHKFGLVIWLALIFLGHLNKPSNLKITLFMFGVLTMVIGIILTGTYYPASMFRLASTLFNSGDIFRFVKFIGFPFIALTLITIRKEYGLMRSCLFLLTLAMINMHVETGLLFFVAFNTPYICNHMALKMNVFYIVGILGTFIMFFMALYTGSYNYLLMAYSTILILTGYIVERKEGVI